MKVAVWKMKRRQFVLDGSLNLVGSKIKINKLRDALFQDLHFCLPRFLYSLYNLTSDKILHLNHFKIAYHTIAPKDLATKQQSLEFFFKYFFLTTLYEGLSSGLSNNVVQNLNINY